MNTLKNGGPKRMCRTLKCSNRYLCREYDRQGCAGTELEDALDVKAWWPFKDKQKAERENMESDGCCGFTPNWLYRVKEFVEDHWFIFKRIFLLPKCPYFHDCRNRVLDNCLLGTYQNICHGSRFKKNRWYFFKQQLTGWMLP